MARLILHKIPDALLRRLKERAAQNGRSLNNEAIHCLELALAAQAIPNAYLNRIRPLREKTVRMPLTEERLQATKEEGRS